jgi:hypothetical protein
MPRTGCGSKNSFLESIDHSLGSRLSSNHEYLEHHLPGLRLRQTRGHADGCLPVFLPMRQLQCGLETETRRLLRLLLVWLEPMPAEKRRGFVLSFIVVSRNAGSSLNRCLNPE